jgi:hypothetical protein
LEIDRRVLAQQYRKVAVPALEPFLERGTTGMVWREIEAPVEGVEGELAKAIGFSPQKRNDGSLRARQSQYPAVD